jgi:hypothetical protein
MRCAACDRVYYRRPWRGIRPRWQGVRLAGEWYCRAECLQRALAEMLGREQPIGRREAALPHRVPLGLLLLSRQQLTAEQLRAALEAQRNSGGGRIGEWLQQLGFATEAQITAGLARQWSCPVLRTPVEDFSAECGAAIPFPLLEAFQMIPVELGELTGTLLVAFSEAVDYGALYAIEQMLGVRTEACFMGASILQNALAALARRQRTGGAVLHEVEDGAECARLVGSCAAEILAEQVRWVRCGGHLWVRLERQAGEAVNLVLETSAGGTRGAGASRHDLASTA